MQAAAASDPPLPRPAHRAPRGRVWLMLVLLALLTAGVLAVVWRGVYQPAQVAIHSAQARSADLQTQVETLAGAQGELSGTVTATKLKVAALEQALDRLYARVSSQDAAWRVAEAEHLLRTAAEMAALRRDAAAATAALAGADRALAAIRDPAWAPVRAAIAEAQAQLAAHPQPDVEGIRHALRALDSALLAAPLADQPPALSDRQRAAPAGTWWQRIRAALLEVFVLRRDAGSAVVGPEAGFLVRQMVRLRFAQAELALDMQDGTALRARLADIQALLAHYRSDAGSVRYAHTELERLGALPVGVPLPDITPPVRVLNEVQNAQRLAGGAS